MTATCTEETRFRSLSPPMDYRFTAVAAAPDSTTAGNRNSDPVNGLSYRPITSASSDSGPPAGLGIENSSSGNNPQAGPGPATTNTRTGYVNGGPSINYRPRHPEPSQAHQEGEIPADLDVDFDNKCSEEYSKLDDHNLRATYDVARGECSTSPEHLTGVHPMYGGVQNNSKKEIKRARRNCMLQCCIVLLLVANLISLALGAFVLANTYNIGVITGSPQVSNEDLVDTIELLKQQVSSVQSDFNAYRDMHDDMFNAIILQIEQVRQNFPSEDDVTTPPNTSLPPDVATPDSTTPLPSSVTPTSSGLASISIYQNCTRSRRGVCQVSRSSLLGNSPGFASCATNPIVLRDESEGFISDVFCSVSAEQIMPITSSLLYTDGNLSCYCHAFEITNLVQPILRDFDCELFVTHCPAQVQLPAN